VQKAIAAAAADNTTSRGVMRHEDKTGYAVPAWMRAVQFRSHGGIESIEQVELPTPAPDSGEVLVRVRAIALNGFDAMVMRGIPGLPIPLPMIPCADCAGEIVSCGGAVDRARWRIGQRVTVVPLRPGSGMMGETLPGVAADFIAVPQTALLPLPDGVSYIHAAALPTAYGTALRMMRTRARVLRGERVLILGASGGVGTACVQLARQAGAEIVACTRTPAAVALLQRLGADHVIDTSSTDFRTEVVRLYGKPSIWGGGGVDLVVNAVGGESWNRALACLGRRGRVVTCGASAGTSVETDLRYVWSFEIEILGSNGWDVQDQQTLLEMAASRAIEPVIHSVRPIDDFAQAMAELESQAVLGKSVLCTDPDQLT
jgi:alcohol dehydrogenase